MTSIRQTLEAVAARLDEFIRAAAGGTGDWVVISNLVDAEGRAAERARRKLVMFLAGIQKETVVSTYTAAVPAGGTGYAIVAPPLYVDLYVLLVANFDDEVYAEGLEVISLAISFFQQNPSFTPDTLPSLPPTIDRLSFEMTNLGPLDLSYVMGLAGVKYLPSAYYRVRLLPFQAGAIQRQEPAVQGVETPGDPQDPLPEPPPTLAARVRERPG
jgi:hypothetical protein